MDSYLNKFVEFLKTQFTFEEYSIQDNFVILSYVTLLMDIKCENGKVMKKGDYIQQITIPTTFHFETFEGDSLGVYGGS